MDSHNFVILPVDFQIRQFRVCGISGAIVGDNRSSHRNVKLPLRNHVSEFQFTVRINILFLYDSPVGKADFTIFPVRAADTCDINGPGNIRAAVGIQSDRPASAGDRSHVDLFQIVFVKLQIVFFQFIDDIVELMHGHAAQRRVGIHDLRRPVAVIFFADRVLRGHQHFIVETEDLTAVDIIPCGVIRKHPEKNFPGICPRIPMPDRI